ncbi:MAG: serine hydroxymethyltransferase [Candidatus Bathyarchaeota archaeon]|nr:serine hydroxymethyltransferase [Candidatus Bathyarchaeum tardum]WGM88961.1 MAG: serine hydroxymethyltransferase [Candidatus Bathyarchaeum tardum]WNZ28802.1 MAG: serine hydroxymethyltransferase [Candidatus Bathyarchaeota archaeon]
MEAEFLKLALGLVESNENHERYRGKECMNLIASEGIKSPAVNEIMHMSKDLDSRYAEGENDLKGHVKARHYQGQKFMTKIEDYATDLMKNLFGCNWADVRLVSGTHANLATFKGLSMATKNDRMVVLPLSAGAHITHDYSGLAGSVLGLETINHAYDIDELNIDVEKSSTIIDSARPGIVTFGGSVFPFPHPVKELAKVAKDNGAYVAYDAAHVLGLIAGGEFQNPFKEGVDFITASTHKTFPGPQGGVILANCEDDRMKKAIKKVQYAVFPLSASSTHLGRLPALGLAALEMKLYGKDLAKQTIRNAQTAGKCMFENGVKVLGQKNGFTRSHQIVVDVREYGGGQKLAFALEDAHIILNKNLLPYDNQHDRGDPSGLRIGFQDVSRRGFKPEDVEQLCSLILDVVKGKRTHEDVRKDVIKLRQNFNEIKYGFQSVSEAKEYLKKHV